LSLPATFFSEKGKEKREKEKIRQHVKKKTRNNNKPLAPKTLDSKRNDDARVPVKFRVDAKVTECGSVQYLCNDAPILKKNVFLRVKRDRI